MRIRKITSSALHDVADDLWNHETKGVDQQQSPDEARRQPELPVYYSLDRHLLEELQVLRVLTEQLGDKEVVNLVEVLRFDVDPTEVMSILEIATLPTHHQVYLDLYDQGNEVDVGVLHFYSVFFRKLDVSFHQFLELAVSSFFLLLASFDQLFLNLFTHIVEANELFNACRFQIGIA